MKTLVIAGKEPFLNPRRLFELLEFASSLRPRDFAIGVVTNGRHIERHWDRLAESAANGCLDFLDVSIDSGIPEQHDTIRGLPGTHALAVAALRKAARELKAPRVGACSVLRSDNPTGILELIRRQSDLVKRFWIFPIQPPPFSDLMPLGPASIVAFLRDIANLLASELSGSGLVVTVPLQGIYLAEAAQAGFVQWDALREDGLGNCVSSMLAGGNWLNVQCCVLPEQASKLARITYTGDYLAQLHFLQTPNPGSMAIGNVANEPIREIYRRSVAEGSILHRLVRAREKHECKEWTCWQHCFGGWSVAEQSLIDNTTLTSRPRLCKKLQSDLVPITGVRAS